MADIRKIHAYDARHQNYVEYCTPQPGEKMHWRESLLAILPTQINNRGGKARQAVTMSRHARLTRHVLIVRR
jgi:hypothetical protein